MESMLPRSAYSDGSAQFPPTSSVLGLLWTARGPDSHESQQGPFPLLPKCPTASITGSGWWSNLLKPNSETHETNNFLWPLKKYVGCCGANTAFWSLSCKHLLFSSLNSNWVLGMAPGRMVSLAVGVWFSPCGSVPGKCLSALAEPEIGVCWKKTPLTHIFTKENCSQRPVDVARGVIQIQTSINLAFQELISLQAIYCSPILKLLSLRKQPHVVASYVFCG